jgi:hypothetical protein
MVRADGSVTLVPYTVDALTWFNFCRMNDGQPIAGL